MIVDNSCARILFLSGSDSVGRPVSMPCLGLKLYRRDEISQPLAAGEHHHQLGRGTSSADTGIGLLARRASTARPSSAPMNSISM